MTRVGQMLPFDEADGGREVKGDVLEVDHLVRQGSLVLEAERVLSDCVGRQDEVALTRSDLLQQGLVVGVTGHASEGQRQRSWVSWVTPWARGRAARREVWHVLDDEVDQEVASRLDGKVEA